MRFIFRESPIKRLSFVNLLQVVVGQEGEVALKLPDRVA
jgi:hypothetical protein